MNVNVKPRAPFQKRRLSPIAAQATASAETFVRYLCVRAVEQLERRRDAYAIACAKFPGDARLRTVIRATAEPPTDLSNTPALAVMGTDYVESLQPISAAARLFRASRVMLNFDRYASISVPDLFGIDDEPPPWVAPGDPAPVGELTSGATVLQPYKLEFIVTVTRETLLGSNAEKLIGDLLRKKVAFGLDQILFDALPATAGRPAGLRSYNTRLPESQWTSGNENAMMQDVNALIGAAEHIAGGEPFYMIGRSKRIAAMRQIYKIVPENMVLLPSAASLALPESVLLCVVPAAVPSAIGVPEVELVDSGAVEMNDDPQSTDLMQGANVRSLFQSDTIGIKVRLPASWALRHPAGANWITCLWPADMSSGGGGGGIPDAPADQFYYGRHQGGWEMVAEEAPIDGQTYGRQSTAWTPIPPAVEEAPPDGWTYGRRNTGWQQLEQIFANVNSPTFTGQPRAPHPAPFDDTTQLATTAWTRATIATEGGGVEEVPAAPFGAFARVRGAGGATWQDFVTLGVAPLLSPAFTGNPTAPTQPGGSRDARIATCEFVIDELAGVATGFLPLTGGTLTGQLIVPSGGLQTNVSLGFGDVQTGVYRAGATLGFSVTGLPQMQLMGSLAAFFVPVNMGNFTIQSLGDPAQPTDALNLRTGDTRYLRSGGPLISPPGNSPTDVGLGVGDATTGFYRQGTSLAIAALGDAHMLFNSNRTAQILWPLSVSGNVISNVGAPVNALDAANKTYVDTLAARATPFLFDIPIDYPLAADGTWITLLAQAFTIPARAVDTLVLVSLSLNLRDVNATAILAARLNVQDGPTPERQAWTFGSPFPALSSGVTIDLYAVVRGVAPNITIQLMPRAISGASNPMTVLGTDPLTRSQLLIVDLGPVT